jgi:dethiobiotin synthetase/adenosylmethionine--8-amino-7-oxononanoate aminotransferase
MVIDSAHNDCFDAYYAKPPAQVPTATATETRETANGAESLLNSYFDGSASWFT